MTAIVLALLGVSLASAVFSSAAFTSNTTRNPGNTFTAGHLVFADSKADQAVINVQDLVPGGSSAGNLTLTNSGDVAATATMSIQSISDTPTSPALSAALQLKIEDTTAGTTLYSGALTSVGTLNLGSFSAGQSRSYRLTVTFPTGAAVGGLQGATTTVTLRFQGATP